MSVHAVFRPGAGSRRRRRGSPTARPSGFALAHAFLGRGATAVLGAAATLNDAVAAEVMRRLYTRALAADPFDLPAAVTSALRGLRDAGVPIDVEADLAGLRVAVL